MDAARAPGVAHALERGERLPVTPQAHRIEGRPGDRPHACRRGDRRTSRSPRCRPRGRSSALRSSARRDDGRVVEGLKPLRLHGEDDRARAGDDAGPAVAHLAARGVELGERRGAAPAGRNAQEPPEGVGSEDDLVAVAPAPAPSRARGREPPAPHPRPDLLQHAVGEEADPPPVGGEERIRRSRGLRKRARLEESILLW